ncbi:MAG: hypothetical protein CMP59_02755 [Flavobacteriales bacterium]|nr:hypothetical protein [Flavobacteriales bacterium]|tara:strand:- start:1727 stop:2605 length:879 start_codon:yes stop_codon:yes gene_type:complete
MNEKIDLMIVGAQKAGTTSLKKYLEEHPSICSHKETEFAYFRSDSQYANGFEKEFNNSFGRDIANDSKIIAKSAGLYVTPKAIERLHDHNPDCKIVFLIREPVSRAYSSYCMERFNGWLENEFSDIVRVAKKKKAEDPLYTQFVNMGLYHLQLSNLLEHFSPDKIRVFVFEEFMKDPQKICSEIYSWLNVDPNHQLQEKGIHNKTEKERSKQLSMLSKSLRKPNNPIKRLLRWLLPYSWFVSLSDKFLELNKSGKKFEAISETDKSALKEFYSEHNQKLFKMLNRSIPESWT